MHVSVQCGRQHGGAVHRTHARLRRCPSCRHGSIWVVGCLSRRRHLCGHSNDISVILILVVVSTAKLRFDGKGLGYNLLAVVVEVPWRRRTEAFLAEEPEFELRPNRNMPRCPMARLRPIADEEWREDRREVLI